MKNKNILKSLVLFLLCIAKTNAQEVLTIENALKIALENNFEIKTVLMSKIMQSS